MTFNRMQLILAVGLGSAIGAVARWLCSLAILGLSTTGIPWSTLFVNFSGSFLIGYLAHRLELGHLHSLRPVISHFWMPGFCGGFTTFSLFSLETLQLWQQGQVQTALTLLLLSPPLWVIAAAAGFHSAHRAFGPRPLER
jgi:CrcB protein